MKAHCSQSMHFWRINIHISNIINTYFSLHLTVTGGSSVDDIMCILCDIRDKRGERTKAKHRSQIRSTKWGFVKENVGWFRYKPRGDWFCFAYVRKRCLFCVCEWEFSFSHTTFPRGMHVTHTYYVILPGLLPLMAVRCSEREVIITFEIWIFSLQKRKDSLQGAFIHPPEPCKRHFITVRVLYFKSSEQDPANTCLVPS